MHCLRRLAVRQLGCQGVVVFQQRPYSLGAGFDPCRKLLVHHIDRFGQQEVLLLGEGRDEGSGLEGVLFPFGIIRAAAH